MKKERSLAFYRLLHDIEFKIGNECYNGNIQNYGPGGVWEGEGREFRYPVRFVNKKGQFQKYRSKFPMVEDSTGQWVSSVLDEFGVETAHYAFGANELHIMRGIRLALEEMERRFGLDFDALLEQEAARQGTKRSHA